MRNPPSRTRSSKGIPTPCCSKVGIKRGPWTPQEDELLANYVNKEGEGQWRTLPQRAGLRRCGKSCRLRWMNYLRPCIKRGRIALDEEDLILRLHRLLGNRWSLIAGRIPGRTDNEIKNYWNTHLSKKLISQGIDPRTHKPLIANPNLINSSQKISNNIISAPIQNSTTANSFPLEENGRVYRAVPIRVSENFTMTTNLRDKIQNQVVDDDADADADAGEKNWPNFDGFINMDLQNGHHAQNNEDDQDYNIGNGNEDTFSSFLDSLLNENVYMYQQRQQLQHPDMIGPSAADQPIVPSSQAFNHGNINWEAEVTSSMAALGHEEDGA